MRVVFGSHHRNLEAVGSSPEFAAAFSYEGYSRNVMALVQQEWFAKMNDFARLQPERLTGTLIELQKAKISIHVVPSLNAIRLPRDCKSPVFRGHSPDAQTQGMGERFSDVGSSVRPLFGRKSRASRAGY